MLTESKYLPVNTRNTAVRVRGILRCAKVHYRTHTRGTRFKNTAGLPVPVLNPTGNPSTDSPSLPACMGRPLDQNTYGVFRPMFTRCKTGVSISVFNFKSTGRSK
jgi:hypothetical protein